MTRLNRRTHIAAAKAARPPHRRGSGKSRFGERDLRRRLRAAGLEGDTPPDQTRDEMAISITRKAAMIINRWPGCRERLCVRMRGCMAPHGDCGNARVIRLSPEEEQRRFVETVRLLQEQLARRLAAGEDIGD